VRIRREPAIQIKTAAQLAAMAEAGQVVARALSAAAAAVAPGVSTAELDAIAAGQIRAAGAAPSFLGYHGFPATICACINNEVVHGIPQAARRPRDGDVVSIDCGAIVDGWHADAAVTVPVGSVTAAHFEHTVAITASGPWVLTAADGGREGLARLAPPPRQLAQSHG